MPRKTIKPQSWDDCIQKLINNDSRYMIRRSKKTPYLSIRDSLKNKEFSLNPIRAFDNMPEVCKVAELIEHIGDKEWNFGIPIEKQLAYLYDPDIVLEKNSTIYVWENVAEITLEHLIQSQKQTSAKNTKADLNTLKRLNLPFKWDAIKSWIFEKQLETRPFKNRLDSLEQIRLALSNKNGTEPNWIKRSNLDLLREQHNRANKKAIRYQPNKEIGNIRGIPTREEAEKYLDELAPDFLLEQWCLAIQLCYGLRNHELFHISKISDERKEEGIKENWIYVPGEWRTKSKFEHWTFPLYSSWIIRYGLKNNFDAMQTELRTKAKMDISSAVDKSKKWKPGNPNDLGVCQNNDYLGMWISKRLRTVLPPWYASIPDARGVVIDNAERQQIRPYDLRHTYAIRMATDKRCINITEDMTAQAMGHDLKTHRKHYQMWISSKQKQQQIMLKTQSPPDF